MNSLLAFLSVVTITLSVFLLRQIDSSSKPAVIATAILPTPDISISPAPEVKGGSAEEYTLIATGDVMPARAVNSKSLAKGNFHYPFEKTQPLLKSADLVFINLEAPLVPNCEPTLIGMIFCADERAVDGLVYAGVTVANLANNHVGNYGSSGISNTVSVLKQNGIKVTGAGEAAIVSLKDKKFGFLGYNSIGVRQPGLDWADPEKISKDIRLLKGQVDFVIVAFHWGVEYTSYANEVQRSLAHTAVDAGADLIIGNHPHWVQGTEIYRGKFITYSLGNFVFDQMWSAETRQGIVGKYTFNTAGLAGVQFIPIIIEDYSQPRPATETEAEEIIRRQKQASFPPIF